MKKQLVILSIFLAVFTISTEINTLISPNYQTRNPSSLTLKSCLDGINNIFRTKKKSEVVQETIGLEIELFKPNELEQRDIAIIISNKLSELGYTDITIEKINSPNIGQFDYIISSKKNGEFKHWGLPSEPDLYNHETGNSIGVEVTSPILKSAKDFNDYFLVINTLKEEGLTKATDIGGNHIHIGHENMTAGELYKLFNYVLNNQESIIQKFSPEQGRRNISFGPLVMSLNRLKNIAPETKLNELDSGFTFFNQGAIRYNKKHKTLEFRFFNSSLNHEELNKNIDYSKSLLKDSQNQ